jgi:hypothetical protein
MKKLAKKYLSRSLMLLLLTAIGVATLPAKSSATPLKVGDEYGGGKIVYIFQPGDAEYAETTEQAVISPKTDISGNIFWSDVKTSTDKLDNLGYSERNRQGEARQNQFAAGAISERNYYGKP